VTARTSSTDEEGLRALYEALDALRRSEDPFDSRHDGVWRVLVDWVRARTRQGERRRDDVVQETLLAIARHVHQMDAATPRQAARWASIILRRKHIDLARTDATDAVAQGLSEGDAALDSAQSPEPAPPPELLEAHQRRIEEVVLRHIEHGEPSASVRLTRRSMARAALYRLVLDLEPEAVEARLALPEPVGKDRLYKWIERGRAIVAEAMRAWMAAHPEEPEILAISDVVIELVEARRADAGKPRPERRRV
jgi:DNA-directed RNA polymerase specialized sigma24 family protein